MHPPLDPESLIQTAIKWMAYNGDGACCDLIAATHDLDAETVMRVHRLLTGLGNDELTPLERACWNVLTADGWDAELKNLIRLAVEEV